MSFFDSFLKGSDSVELPAFIDGFRKVVDVDRVTTRFAVGEADPDPLTAMWEPAKSVDFYCTFGNVLAVNV